VPVTPTYPGVYVEEVPSPVRTIVGVSTATTAFVGYTQRGPTNTPVRIFNYGDFDRRFGGLDSESRVSYAIQQFFQNGGGEAYVVRVAAGARRASASVSSDTDPASDPVLMLEASSEGQWGNALRVQVDYATTNPSDLFNLEVTEYIETPSGDLVPGRTESFRNLSMSPSAQTFAVTTINANAALIDAAIPAGALASVEDVPGVSLSGTLTEADLNELDADHKRLAVTVSGQGPFEFNVTAPVAGADVHARIDTIAADIQREVREKKPGNPVVDGFTCVRDGERLRASAGVSPPDAVGADSFVRFAPASTLDATTILKLGLGGGGVEMSGAAGIRPAETGTVGNGPPDIANLPADGSIRVIARRGGTALVTAEMTGASAPWTVAPTTAEQVRAGLESALHKQTAEQLKHAVVVLEAGRLHVVAGGDDPLVEIVFEQSATLTPAQLLGDAPVVNLSAYPLGSAETGGALQEATPGSDGLPPGPAELIGNRGSKTGLFALESVDLFNILCIPGGDPNVFAAAIPYCAERRAFLIMDLPESVDDVDKAKSWLSDNGLKHKNAATYFPWVLQPDPLANFRVRPFPPSGAIAGLYARTDGARGVWKAPAGIEASLLGVRGSTFPLTDGENGVLNQVGVNCIRSFPNLGTVVWGARTANGSDAEASEWKYVPVRRVALFIEESLFRGTQYAVFEPNDEPLWSSIRMNVGAFMQNLFRQGAFQGASAREAYLVKCDGETTTQNDINLGIVNILVGFAPLKPAEFVILKISQLAGQVQT
jgi:phage tail sheath protein FI